MALPYCRLAKGRGAVHLHRMRERSRPPVELVTDRHGIMNYHVRMPPDGLPPVRSGDLEESWDAARRAAADSVWGEPRLFRFRADGADPVDLALTDADAACWAEAIDAGWGLHTAYGLSLCLRLLGLVALLSDSAALRALCPLSRAGAALDPALIRAAATVPLSARGDLDESCVCAHLALAVPPRPAIPHSGASS